MKKRNANRILIFSAAAAGAVAVVALPADILEMVVLASGIPSIVPAAAPPVGETAHILIAAGAGSTVAAITAWLSPWKASLRDVTADGIWGSRLLPRLPFASRRSQRPHGLIETDVDSTADLMDFAGTIRRSDAHPDAPPRPPVFASRELGNEALPPVSDAYSPEALDSTGSISRAPEPLPWDVIQQEMQKLATGMAGRSSVSTSDADEMLSLQDMLDRLERGLERRRDSSAGTVEGPSHRAADRPRPIINEELEDALAVLRSITAKAS